MHGQACKSSRQDRVDGASDLHCPNTASGEEPRQSRGASVRGRSGARGNLGRRAVLEQVWEGGGGKQLGLVAGRMRARRTGELSSCSVRWL